MDIPTHEELVQRIDAFLQRHDMAPSRLGRAVTGEPNLIFSIREGRQPNLDTLNRLARFMAEQDELLATEQAEVAAADAHETTPSPPEPEAAEWPLPDASETSAEAA